MTCYKSTLNVCTFYKGSSWYSRRFNIPKVCYLLGSFSRTRTFSIRFFEPLKNLYFEKRDCYSEYQDGFTIPGYKSARYSKFQNYQIDLKIPNFKSSCHFGIRKRIRFCKTRYNVNYDVKRCSLFQFFMLNNMKIWLFENDDLWKG